jgi:hypothetical protein
VGARRAVLSEWGQLHACKPTCEDEKFHVLYILLILKETHYCARKFKQAARIFLIDTQPVQVPLPSLIWNNNPPLVTFEHVGMYVLMLAQS